jgi:hypothetical protein
MAADREDQIPQSLRLMHAFYRIKDPASRSDVVRLVELTADREEAALRAAHSAAGRGSSRP